MSIRRRSDANRAASSPWLNGARPSVGLAVLAALFCYAAGLLSQNGPAVAARNPPQPALFYVAQDGSDDNPGAKEKPFATLDRAGRPSGPW